MSRAVDVLATMDGLLTFASTGVESDDPARQMIEAGHEARAAVAELIEAVQERRTMSARGRQSTGPFAESDARIDAALARCQPKGD